MNKNKILYVDDESINLQLFEINFSKNYIVFTAPDAIAALEILSKHPNIKIIVSDMKMPIMNGIQFITKAKALYPAKKFYILTGFEITDQIQSALENGLIIEYFRKPFNMLQIELSIQNALERI